MDFYDEGTLLWLEVDVMIRTQTKGAKSLDDFCKTFFGGGQGRAGSEGLLARRCREGAQRDRATRLEGALRARVEVPADAPAGRHHWRRVEALVHGEAIGLVRGAGEHVARREPRRFASVCCLAPKARSRTWCRRKPSAKAGLAPGMKVIAVNGRRFSADGLKTAVANTKTGGKLELLVESGDFFKPHLLNYKDGAKYPRLEKTDGTADLLAEIVKTKAK